MVSFLNESYNWNSSNSFNDQSMDFDDSDLNNQHFANLSIIPTNKSLNVASPRQLPVIAVVAISITQTIFTIFGIFLKSLIIYYEHFGRDTKKRPLLNRLIGGLCEWAILKNLADIAIAMSSIATNGLNYHFAFFLWFMRLYGLLGTLLSFNEVLLVRYIVKVILRNSFLLNDALLSIWIKLCNLVVALVLTLTQTKSELFQRSVLHLVFPNEYSNDGLRIRIVVTLCLFCLGLAFLNFAHVCIVKLKKKTVIVPIQEVPNLVINNQAYNKDLFDSFAIAVYIIAATICNIPIAIINTNAYDLIPTMSNYFDISLGELLVLFSKLKGLVHAILTGFLLPLIVMLCSSELKPFLIRILCLRE